MQPAPYKKVLSNTYLFTSLGLLLASIGATISVDANLITSWISLLVYLVIGIVLVVTASIKAESSIGFVLACMFFAIMGVLMGPAIALSDGKAILLAATMTIFLTVALSAYVLYSKKDFSFLGTWLFISLIGIILISIANVFLQIPEMHTLMSYVSLVVFSGFMLYDTSEVVHGHETNYIRASLSIFLNIINIFQSLLSVLADE